MASQSSLEQQRGLNKPQVDTDPASEGNRYFVGKEYLNAVAVYTKAIENNPKMPKLYANRSMAYLKLQNPKLALKNAESGLELEPANAKLLYRKGKALAFSNRFDEAIDFLASARKKFLFPYENRTAVLRQFGFECDCRLCMVDRADPEPVSKRYIEIDEICRGLCELEDAAQLETSLSSRERTEFCRWTSFIRACASGYS